MEQQKFLDDAAEVAAFAKTLHELWWGSCWDEVEPYARKAWTQLAEIGDRRPWEEVRPFVQESWFLN